MDLIEGYYCCQSGQLDHLIIRYKTFIVPSKVLYFAELEEKIWININDNSHFKISKTLIAIEGNVFIRCEKTIKELLKIIPDRDMEISRFQIMDLS